MQARQLLQRARTSPANRTRAAPPPPPARQGHGDHVRADHRYVLGDRRPRTAQRRPGRPPARPSLDDPDPISLAATTANIDRLTLGFTVAAFLIALAVINAIVATVFSAQDTARNHAILRTLGATPDQTVTSFLVAHLAASPAPSASALGSSSTTPSEASSWTRSDSLRSPTSPRA